MLASGAYAIGSQQGDGGAIAASAERAGGDRVTFGPEVRPAPAPPPGARDRFVVRAPAAFPLRRTARTLGVTTAELRAALRDVRPERPPFRDGGPSGGLADKLGVSEEQLREAFEELHDGHPERGSHEAELADALGVSEDELRDAFEQLRRGGRPARDPAKALADALGIERSTVAEAMETLREQKEAEFAGELADALGIEQSAVRQALDEQRAEMEARQEDLHADFVKRLADRLGVSEAKVEEALPAMPHPPAHGPGPGPGHGQHR